MKRVVFLAIAASLSGCGGEEPAPPEPPASAEPGPSTATATPDPSGPEPGLNVADGRDSNYGTVELTAGFTPDPHVVEGTSGGHRNAISMNAQCNGWVSPRADHILEARDAFTELRVMAHSDEDTTLIIEKPDGSYLCNDDFGGARDPMIRGPFAAGRYKVWVGSYQRGATPAYRLGFSELEYGPERLIERPATDGPDGPAAGAN